MDIFVVEHSISREYFNIHVEIFFLLMDGQFELFFSIQEFGCYWHPMSTGFFDGNPP
jgi:hypothetical protein